MSPSGPVRTTTTRVLSLLMVLVGVALLVSTLGRGGGPLSVGIVFGVLFCAAGAARLYGTRGRGSA
jgi:hypothetical protein